MDVEDSRILLIAKRFIRIRVDIKLSAEIIMGVEMKCDMYWRSFRICSQWRWQYKYCVVPIIILIIHTITVPAINVTAITIIITLERITH